MAYKFRNLTNSTITLLGHRTPGKRRTELKLQPERHWAGPPYPPKIEYVDTQDMHHPAPDVVVNVHTRRSARVYNLPDPEPQTFFIVDRDVAEAANHRDDLVYVSRETIYDGVPFATDFATAVLGGTPVRVP